LPLDEAGLFFAASGKFSQPWERAKRKALLELYSASKGHWVAKIRASDANRPDVADPIHWPSLSILGATTPGNFYEGLHEDAFKDGLMARLLVVTREEMPSLRRIKGHPSVPPSLVARLKDAFMAVPVIGNLGATSTIDSSRVPLVHTARWADDAAEDELYAIEQWASDISASKETDGLIVNRAGEQTVKLATIRALSRDAADPAVSAQDIAWGFGVVRRSHETIKRDSDRHMAGSDFERLCKAIVEAVSKAGSEGIKRSDLLRRSGVKHAKPYEVEAAMKRLVQETGQLVSKISTEGRPGCRYFLAE
jgi:hypothetical protein